MSTADFSVTGSSSGAHASGSAGLVEEGETLTFQLEASPGLDIERAEFSVVVADSIVAPAMVLSPSDGVPTPTPLSPVTTTMPAGVRAYRVRSVVNRGIDKLGKVRPEWVRERVIYTVTGVGTRKLTPGETTEGDPDYGWTKAFNDLVDAQGGGNVVGPGSSTAHAVAGFADGTGQVLEQLPLTVVTSGDTAKVTPTALDAIDMRGGFAAGSCDGIELAFGSSPFTDLDISAATPLTPPGGITLEAWPAVARVLIKPVGGDVVINSIVASGLAAQFQSFELVNWNGSYSITLKNEGSGTAGNRMLTPGLVDLVIPPHGTAVVTYISDRWYVSAPGANLGLSQLGTVSDNAIVRADGTSGANAQGSDVTISDAGTITVPDGQGVDCPGALAIGENASSVSISSGDVYLANGATGVMLRLMSAHGTAAAKRYAFVTRDTDWGPSQAPPTTGLWDYVVTWGFNVADADGRKADDSVNLWAEASEAEYVKPADGTVHGEWYRFAEKGDGNHATTQYRVLSADFDFTNTLGAVAIAGRLDVTNTAGTSTQFVIADGGNVCLPLAGGAKLIVGASAPVGTEEFRVQGEGIISGGLRVGAAAVPSYTVQVTGSLAIDDAATPTEGWAFQQSATHIWKMAPTGAAWTMYLGGAAATTNGVVTVDPGNGNTSMAGITCKLTNGSTTRVLTDSSGVELDGNLRHATSIAPSALAAGRTDNYAPTNIDKATAVYLTADAAGSQLSGISASQSEGTTLYLYPDATGVLTLNHEDTNSTAANRFICPGGVNWVCLAPDCVRLRYRAGSVNRWLVG